MLQRSATEQLSETIDSLLRVVRVFVKDMLVPSAIEMIAIISLWQMGMMVLAMSIYASIFRSGLEPTIWMALVGVVFLLCAGGLARAAFRPRKWIDKSADADGDATESLKLAREH